MSSSKHMPNQRKRPISEVDAEFPSLPVSSFKETARFARKSQEALLSVRNGLSSADFSKTSSLFLPLISPNQLQHGLKVNERSVFVIVRKSYPLLKQEVDVLNFIKFAGIYVRGPEGVGKSYLLYLLAAEYRLNREKYHQYGCLLRELVTTFYDDTIREKSIVKWCKAVYESYKEGKMMKMIDSIVNYIHQNNLEWILIFDHHNDLFNPSVVKEFPFNLIDALIRKRDSNIKIVFSVSTNNEKYPIEMQGWQTFDISSHRFDEEEFKVWCDHYSLEDNTKVNHDSEEAQDAIYWTGGVPNELFLLWNQPMKGLIEKTLNYRTERVAEMMFHHANFCDKLSEKNKGNLKECISRMALKMSPPIGLEGMDRQLFHVINDDEAGTKIIIALNPVARRALLGYHRKDSLISYLSFVTKLLLKGQVYPNSFKGKISGIYITTMIEICSIFTFKFTKVGKIGLTDDVPEIKTIEIRSVVHFPKNSLPVKTSLKKNLTTLFVPESPTYPKFDFFIWDSRRQVLMGFQVTVLKPISKHSKLESSQEWQLFCFGKEKQTPMEFYWIAPKCCVGTEPGPVWDDSIILFEDLANDFPALGKLVLL